GDGERDDPDDRDLHDGPHVHWTVPPRDGVGPGPALAAIVRQTDFRPGAFTGRGSGRTGLEIRALTGDLVAREGEEVAAVDLDRLPLAGGAGEAPFRDPAVARDEVAGLGESRVREHLEHPRERLAHPLA